MKSEDYTKTVVKIKNVHRYNDTITVHITGLVLPQFEMKDPKIPRSFECIAHERDDKSGKYILHLYLSDPEPREILVSAFWEDYRKLLD